MMSEKNTHRPEKIAIVIVLAAMMGVLIISLVVMAITKISTAGLPTRTPVPARTTTPLAFATPKPSSTKAIEKQAGTPINVSPYQPTMAVPGTREITATPGTRETSSLPPNHPLPSNPSATCESCHSSFRSKGK